MQRNDLHHAFRVSFVITLALFKLLERCGELAHQATMKMSGIFFEVHELDRYGLCQ